MTLLVPLMLIGWIPLSVILFNMLKPHHAVLIIIVGGVLFLPEFEFEYEGFPEYSKTTAIAIGLFLGARFSKGRSAIEFHWKLYDIPMVVFCLGSIASSMSNDLGLYDGFSKTLKNIFWLWIPYMAGRVYFTSNESIRALCYAIIIGGLTYVPLCLFEIRMSPQLSNILYGFFPHDFSQHFRYGGFRPIVFMSHGLMVSLWMALSSVLAFWLWRGRIVKHIKGVPMKLLVGALIVTTILCKSANGWFVLVTGCLFSYVYSHSRSNKALLIFLVLVVAYPGLRISETISASTVESVADIFFDAERVDSLRIRLWQEDLFIEKVMEKPFLGWGGAEGGWPVNEDGDLAVPMIDAGWLIFFHLKGFIGLTSFFLVMLQGPWLIFRYAGRGNSRADERVLQPVILGLVVVFYMMDNLFNGMPNTIYFMIAGALISFYHSNLLIRE